jgi:hypothetical protein
MSPIHDPDKPYTEVKSEFIKERISERNFELEDDREYISNLIFLERVILDEIQLGYPSGMKYNSIKNQHHEEYLKILEDLDEEKYRQEKKKQKNKTPSYIKENTQKQKIEELRGEWQKAV